MAKIKISELERVYGIDRKVIIQFLNERGIEAKTANSSVEDDVAEMIREQFRPEEKPAGSPQAAGEKPVKAAEKAAEKKSEAEPAPAAKPAAPSAEKPAQPAAVRERPAERPPADRPKKKKIIIVTNNDVDRRPVPSGQRRPRPQQDNPAQRDMRGRMEAQKAYRPIKPITVPSRMEVDYHKPADQKPQTAQNIPGSRQDAVPVNQEAEEQLRAAAAAAEQTVSSGADETAVNAPVSAPASSETAPVKTDAAQAPRQDTAETPAAQTGFSAENRESRPVQNSPSGQPVQRADRPAERGYDRADRRSDRPDQRTAPARQGERPGSGDRRRPGQDRPAGDRDRRTFRPGQPQRGQGPQGGMRGPGAPSRPGAPARPGAGAPAAPGKPSGDSRGRKPSRDGAFSRDNDKQKDQNKRKGGNDKDRRGKKDFLLNTEDDERTRKNRPGRFIKPEKRPEEEIEEQIKTIQVPEKLTIRELAEKMRMQPSEIIKKLFLKGQVTTVNSELTYEEAEAIALDYEILCEKEETVDVIEELLKEEEDRPEDMTERAPVICVMGHVDHGKTSLLDAIRKTSVTDKEAGGITQHIGAYTVNVNGRMITFLDTPGHEAFTAMRMRGANSTDIAVLVIAADDGVMPQTIEAINHAKAAGVEIIVAVNKIDKPDANIDRVKQEMTEYELIPTDWGGSTEYVPVSAKTGEGIEELLETILLTADIMELKANANRPARGLVLEAKLDKGRGPVANVLIQKGTLHVGDYVSAGEGFGRVRAMVDDKGKRVKEAKPSQPVEVLGLSEVPGAGETIVAHQDEKTARSYAMTYKAQHKADLIEETRMRMSLDDLFNQMKEGTLKEFNLIIKADVQGSAEALRQSLLKLSNDEVIVKVIHAGVGNINESDVTLASASNAVIIGFNVVPDAMAKSMSDREKVDVRLYKVIYQAIDDVEAALKGMLAPVYEEKIIGHAEVRQIFSASSIGNIAGSYVTDGTLQRACKIRIFREDEMIYEGSLASLKRFKDDVKEVREGFECGLVFDGFDKIQVGDRVEAYQLIEVART